MNYINIPLVKKFLTSQSEDYVKRFASIEIKNPSDIIEIHNRPIYINFLEDLKTSFVLYFHNDPLSMSGSKTKSERLNLLNLCSKIIFNSEWSKKRFLDKLGNFYEKSPKLEVIYQSTDKAKIDYKKKRKINNFCRKIKFRQRL